jgi:hypothetical protein
MATSVRPTAGGQAVAEKTGALLASYDLAMSDRRRALRGETDQVRIAYIPCAVQQYLRGPLQKVRRVSPEISRAGTKPWTRRLRIDRQLKCRSYLAGLCQPPFSARRRYSTPGRRGGDLEDCGHVAARQNRWCSEGIAGRPVCEGNSRSETTGLAAHAKP